MNDSEIINLFFLRSESAILELDTKYGKLCKSISFNILHNYEDADECVNDSYLGVWNRIPPEKPNPLMSFVCRIVRNISLSRYEYNSAKKRNSTYGNSADHFTNAHFSCGEKDYYLSGNDENIVLATAKKMLS